jgi:hypothetical protein
VSYSTDARGGPPSLLGIPFRAWFAVDDAHRIVSRPAYCACGREFTQHRLSDAALRICRYPAEQRGAVAAIDRECPDLYVPTHCPPCEHVALGIDARRAETERSTALVTRPLPRPDPRRLLADDWRYERAEREGMESA